MIICVDGPAHIRIGAANCGAPPATAAAAVDNAGSELGITESGVQVSIQNMTHRVNSDDMGGSEGNPTELLFMGAQASIKGVLVKYNSATTKDILAGLFGVSQEGDLILPGSPLFSGGYGFSLVIQGFNSTFYFPRCEMSSQPREFNISTTERKTSFGFTAYPSLKTVDNVTTPYLFTRFGVGAGTVYEPLCNVQDNASYGGSVS